MLAWYGAGGGGRGVWTRHLCLVLPSWPHGWSPVLAGGWSSQSAPSAGSYVAINVLQKWYLGIS